MMVSQRGPLTLGNELQVLNGHCNGESESNLTTRLRADSTVVQFILDRELNLESANARPETRNYLSLGDRIRMLHLLDAGKRACPLMPTVRSNLPNDWQN